MVGDVGKTVWVTQTGSVGQARQGTGSMVPAWSAFQVCYLGKADVRKLESWFWRDQGLGQVMEARAEAWVIKDSGPARGNQNWDLVSGWRQRPRSQNQGIWSEQDKSQGNLTVSPKLLKQGLSEPSARHGICHWIWCKAKAVDQC